MWSATNLSFRIVLEAFYAFENGRKFLHLRLFLYLYVVRV